MTEHHPFNWRHFPSRHHFVVRAVVSAVFTQLLTWVINVDKNAAYPKAFRELKADRVIPEGCELGQVKFLNNLVEPDHRFLKRLVKPGLGIFSPETAWRTLQGYEIMHMKRKGQIRGVEKATSSIKLHVLPACFSRQRKRRETKSLTPIAFLPDFLQQNPINRW